MGLDMYLYNEKDQTLLESEDDSEKILYWRNNRELNDVFRRFCTYYNADHKYFFKKHDLAKLANFLLSSILSVHSSAIDTYNEMYRIEEEEEYDTTKLHREFYVVGRHLMKNIHDIAYKGHEDNSINLFPEDEKATQITKLMNFIMKNLESEEENIVIYLASF